MATQINRYGYPYFHREFASYDAVNGPYFLVILDTVIRHRIRGRIFTVYGPHRSTWEFPPIALWWPANGVKRTFVDDQRINIFLYL
jgi:hypothetical protein